jgi:hypothetical protein
MTVGGTLGRGWCLDGSVFSLLLLLLLLNALLSGIGGTELWMKRALDSLTAKEELSYWILMNSDWVWFYGGSTSSYSGW